MLCGAPTALRGRTSFTERFPAFHPGSTGPVTAPLRGHLGATSHQHHACRQRGEREAAVRAGSAPAERRYPRADAGSGISVQAGLLPGYFRCRLFTYPRAKPLSGAPRPAHPPASLRRAPASFRWLRRAGGRRDRVRGRPRGGTARGDGAAGTGREPGAHPARGSAEDRAGSPPLVTTESPPVSSAPARNGGWRGTRG